MMTRARLESLGMTDAKLERAFREAFDKEIDLSGGDDPGTQMTRAMAFDEVMLKEMATSSKPDKSLPQIGSNGEPSTGRPR